MGLEQIALRDQARQRRDVFMRRVLDTLRGTIRVRPVDIPDVPLPQMYVEMTDETARAMAPLLEAVEILEAIIWASDGCAGHRDCNHSMEPWQRARALLAGKWNADAHPDQTWPSSFGDCVSCDGYILDASEAPHCPTCARLRREGKPL